MNVTVWFYYIYGFNDAGYKFYLIALKIMRF